MTITRNTPQYRALTRLTKKDIKKGRGGRWERVTWNCRVCGVFICSSGNSHYYVWINENADKDGTSWDWRPWCVGNLANHYIGNHDFELNVAFGGKVPKWFRKV